MSFLLCSGDAAFGPAVHGCTDDFDFTLKFERIFFSIIPCALFLVLSGVRLMWIWRRARQERSGRLLWIKLASITVFIAVQLALLILGTTAPGLPDPVFISSLVLEFAAACCMELLIFVEHSRSRRPSILLSIFLFLTILFDIAQTRSIWLRSQNYDVYRFAQIYTLSTAWRVVVAIVESNGKPQGNHKAAEGHTPEEACGIYRLASLWWLNPLLRRGYRSILTVSNLGPLDSGLEVESLQKVSEELLGRVPKGKSNGLALELVRTLPVAVTLPLAPRLLQVGFAICQPVLIQSLLSYLSDQTSATTGTGSGLIGATIVIYVGLPVSQVLYEYAVQRALSKFRACLIARIYQKTTRITASDPSNNDAVTLMSTDIERIWSGLRDVNELWATPLQCGLSAYLLYRQLGVAFVAPLGVITFCSCAAVIATRMIGPRQKKWIEMVEKRVNTTANVMRNIKNIKMVGFAVPVAHEVQSLRVEELKYGNRFRTVSLFFATISYIPILLSPLIAFAVTPAVLDPTTVFTSLAYIYLLTEPLMLLFQDIPMVGAAFTCLQRIQTFLEREDWCDPRQRQYDGEVSLSEKSTMHAADSSVLATITDGDFGWTGETLALRNVNISIKSGLTMIIGPVGSGKSTLCKAFLGEVPCSKGQTMLKGSVSEIGYCSQAPFLRNATVKDNIVECAIWDKTRYMQVIDATMLGQDFLHLPQGDRTVVGSSGVALSGGQKQRIAIARALYQQCTMMLFDDVMGGLDATTERHVFKSVFGLHGLLRKRGTPTILCTNALKHLSSADHVVALSADGYILEQSSPEEVVANEQYVQSLQFEPSENGARTTAGKSQAAFVESDPDASESAGSDRVESEESNGSRMVGSRAILAYYFKRVGTFWTLLFALIGVLFGFFYNFSTVWLQFWSSDTTLVRPEYSTLYWIGMFALFQLLSLASLTGAFAVTMLTIIKRSGTKLHETLLQSVMAAPLHFLTKTDSGAITSYFSQDLTVIDNELPIGLINTNVEGWMAIGAAAIAATSSPYIIITYPFVVVIVYAVQRVYLHTSRQLRLLDLDMKSPLYTHFLETIDGLSTMRAFRSLDSAFDKHNTLLNKSQSPAYLLKMLQRWLTLVLGFVVAGMAVLVVALATQLRSTTGFTGASMIGIMTFASYISPLISSFTLLENSMGAVNRLKLFNENTPVESSINDDDIVPPRAWPETGNIEISNVSASYTKDTAQEKDCVLKSLTLNIRAGEKVAICGRTGSGKSSIILLLLRMLEPQNSSDSRLSIDGLELSCLDRSAVRQRHILVPQEPVFFPYSTTVKLNLDSIAEASDQDCRAALESVGLWGLLQERGGINADLKPETLSHGHKQLFSLARAILRRRVRSRPNYVDMTATLPNLSDTSAMHMGMSTDLKSVQGEKRSNTNGEGEKGGLFILDEFNSSLDHETEQTMLETIRREFQNYTVLMVSHRLDSIMDFDRVIVMEDGCLVEQGEPGVLALQQGSRFRDLYNASRTG